MSVFGELSFWSSFIWSIFGITSKDLSCEQKDNNRVTYEVGVSTISKLTDKPWGIFTTL